MDNVLREQGMIFNQIYKKIGKLHHDCALHSGLSDTAFWILNELYTFKEPVTQSFFSETCGCVKQTVNSAVNVLVNKGYVYLEALPGARNGKVMKLTEEGEAFCRDKLIRVHEVEMRAYRRLSKEERELYFSLEKKWFSLFEEEIKKELK